MSNPIGTIVKSNSHIDYVCQIYGPGEAVQRPVPSDHAFGTFVGVDLEEDGMTGAQIVGVVYNTLLVNPDFGAYGPRLSPQPDLEVFAPDYLSETALLVGILAVGWIDAGGSVSQGVPAPAPAVNSRVYGLGTGTLCDFHRVADGRLQLGYVPLLMGQSDPLVSHLLLNIVDRLATHFPQDLGRLMVIRNNLAWRNMVQPAG